MRRHLAVLILSALAVPSASGQTPAQREAGTNGAAPSAEFALTPLGAAAPRRPYLTGNWGGARSSLADKGVTLDFRYSSFYQGLASGTGDKGFDYGGKFDGMIALESGKMGLWKGGGFHAHLELSHGDLATNLGGALFTTNSAIYWPVDTPDQVVATSLFLTQQLGGRGDLWLGKLQPLDIYATDPFIGGWGIDRFMNLSVAAPPSGLVPVVLMGAVVRVQTGSLTWHAIAGDPNDRTNDYFPGDLFKDGALFIFQGARTATLAGRKTTYTAKVYYSTADGTDFSSIGGMEEGTTTKAGGSYAIAFEFRHNLQEGGEKAADSWGVYAKAVISDGNPNYVKRALIGGIGGKALFFGRPQDYFGLGGSYYNLSDVLEDALAPVFRFGNAASLEAFYNSAVTPWLLVGPDIQYVKSPFGGFDNGLVLGLRTQIRF